MPMQSSTAAESTKMTANCLCCHQPLDTFQETSRGLHPSGGLAFSSPGHYGTMVFDPMDGTSLEIVICDSCLTGAIVKGHVHVSRPDGPTETFSMDNQGD